jgi:Ca2+-transporting ATPase
VAFGAAIEPAAARRGGTHHGAAAGIYVPWLQPLFKTVPLGFRELGICLAAAVVVLGVVEAEKAWRRRGSATDPTPSAANA